MSYCNDEEITREVVPPYTPQQNGIAERKNRTIMNMVRTMLKGKNLPKELWGETVSTAAYLLNRCPTKKLEKITPEEVWSEFKPSLSHLRIFGSVAFRHILGQLRKKLDDKGEKLLLVGYHPTRGYKLFDMSSKRIVVSQDVIVDEIRMFDSKISAVSVQEIDLPNEVIDFQPVTEPPGAVGSQNSSPEIDFLGGNLNFQPINDSGQQPFVTEDGEMSRRPTRQRGVP